MSSPAQQAGDPTPASELSNGGPSNGGLSKGAQIAVGALCVAALLGWYGYTNLGDGAGSYQYYQTLAEFQAAGIPSGRALRVHGYVSDASIERDIANKAVRFSVQNDPPHARVSDPGPILRVVYQSLETPDLFKDGAEVVVEGRLEGRGEQAIFLADNVLAKCPSKFQAEAEGQAL